MAWLPPELELGEEPELKPPEFVDPEFAEPEPVELELEEPEPEEPLVPELDEEVAEPVEVDPVLSVDPGRARASAPAVTTLAMVTAVVVDRTLARPRSRAATA
ncbi:MAG TPA: hypothetical protein VHS30_05000 [Streptosporangiaceae bacterium]|nr:hypothetical protein [Streptosporangiaceae bacterium]